MNIGLYFGSFNPVHNGHLIIANELLNDSAIEKIWFIVSPQNPFKANSTLLNEYSRLHLMKLATEDDPRIRISDIEFSLPRPSYTAVTLVHLQEKYPEHEFSIIMGSDSFQNLHKWKNFESIIKHHSIFVYPRPGFAISNELGAKLVQVSAPLLEISSTRIRQLIRDGKSIRYMVPEKVREEIEKGHYYRK
ncbi:MAG TPA: nicotinate (nicotinamide) nucleotide adenylyltransferase [Chitinophagaceae bacterium]|nr:nicotinate (nicotinamide) nucleotide adenylyltransferase [Chitinophagaceae bacterium]